jgi:hypothetical protein
MKLLTLQHIENVGICVCHGNAFESMSLEWLPSVPFEI